MSQQSNITQPNNIWGRSLVDEFNEIYLQKAGDTATGLIVFDAGIEVNYDSVVNADLDINGTLTVDNLVVNEGVEIHGPVELDNFLRIAQNEYPANPPISGISFTGASELGNEPTQYFVHHPNVIDELTYFTVPYNYTQYTWSCGTMGSRDKMVVLQSKTQANPNAHFGNSGWCLYVDSTYTNYQTTNNITVNTATTLNGTISLNGPTTAHQNFTQAGGIFQVNAGLTANLYGNVNVGQWSASQNTPLVYTNRSRWYFGSETGVGGGGGGGVDFENAVSFGGFSNVSVASTGWNFSNTLPVISAAMPPSTDSSTKIPTTAWVQGAINAHPALEDIDCNSLTITPTNINIPSQVGIHNVWNTGAIFSKSGGPGVSSVLFNIDSHIQTTMSASVATYEVTFQYWNSNSFGVTNFTLVLFPNRWVQPWGTIGDDTYNINNKINGNDNFNYSSGTYAPAGRQFWTYNQAFSSLISGPNGCLAGGLNYVIVDLFLPSTSYSYSLTVRCLDCSAVTAANRLFEIHN